jgi:hypothetical protein
MIRLHDLDELLLQVRNESSKTYILEGVKAYKVGANRAAIISIWIAVAYDIISKIREIAEQGDSEARSEIQGFDKLRKDSKNDKSSFRKLQDFENELLSKALKDFEFINDSEFKYLERIKEDRNLSAHPAFIDSESLFNPTGELVRSHIVHSIKYLLIHKPMQGKAAFDRIMADVKRKSFPKDYESAKKYLNSKYFDRSKDVLIRNIVNGFLTGLLDGSVSRDGNELNVTNTLFVIFNEFPEIFEKQLKNKLPKLIEDIDDSSLWNLLTLISSNQTIWSFLDQASKLRIVEFLKMEATDRNELLNRFGFIKSMNIEELCETIAQMGVLVSAEVEKEIIDYGNSGSYNSAFENGRDKILPLIPYFEAENVRSLITVILSNKHDQIFWAAGSEKIIEAVFDGTEEVFQKVKESWLLLSEKLTEYPDKYERLIEKIKTKAK